MILTDNWAIHMDDYITCDNYTGGNTPERSLDLRSHFTNISEPATYGIFNLAKTSDTFNGHSRMSFDMDLFTVAIRSNGDYREQHIGSWVAGFMTPLKLALNNNMKKVKPSKIYRVYTSVVCLDIKPFFRIRINKAAFFYSKLRL